MADAHRARGDREQIADCGGAAPDRQSDVAQFVAFVSDSRWRFAKTYVESYPHEYTLQQWGDAEAFTAAVDCIERWGVVESFWRAERKYLYVEDRKYWHMGDVSTAEPKNRPTLINRTWLDVSRYREHASALGYQEAQLTQLVERWKALLDRARLAR